MPTSDLLYGLETKQCDVYNVISQEDDTIFQLLFCNNVQKLLNHKHLNFLPLELVKCQYSMTQHKSKWFLIDVKYLKLARLKSNPLLKL